MPGGPYLNAKDSIDLFVNGLIVNEKVGAAAMDQLEKCKDKRFFIFVQFIQPDKNGHKYGEKSLEYSDGIKSDDFWTGKIIDKLKELKIYDQDAGLRHCRSRFRHRQKEPFLCPLYFPGHERQERSIATAHARTSPRRC